MGPVFSLMRGEDTRMYYKLIWHDGVGLIITTSFVD